MNAKDMLSAVMFGETFWGKIKGTYTDQADLNAAMNAKQATLVSGTNIKTINNQSLLGSGNIEVSGGGGETWEKIAEVTTTEEVSRIDINVDSNGNPFSLKKVFARVMVIGTATNSSTGNCGFTINANAGVYNNALVNVAGTTTSGKSSSETIYGEYFGFGEWLWFGYDSGVNSGNARNVMSGGKFNINGASTEDPYYETDTYCTSVSHGVRTGSNVLGVGSKIILYGVRS